MLQVRFGTSGLQESGSHTASYHSLLSFKSHIRRSHEFGRDFALTWVRSQ